MNRPVITKSEIVAELCRGEGNPRNSEGDFARLGDGRILFAWCRYHGETAEDHDPCNIEGMCSSDNGLSFERLPHTLVNAADHGVQNVMSVCLHRLANGELVIIYLCKKGPLSAVYLRRAQDDETSFGEAEEIVPFEDGMYYVLNNSRVCPLPDGRLLIPVACHKMLYDENGNSRFNGFAYTEFYVLDKEGRNPIKISGKVEMPMPAHSGTGLQEPGAVCLPDGRIYGYFRTDMCFQYESFSEDGGRTWSNPVPSRFTSPASPMLIRKNPYDDTYFAFYNPIPMYDGRYPENSPWITAGRTPFAMRQSKNGIDFSPLTVIEDDPDRGFCYPAVFFLNENEFLLAYCCGGRDDGNCLTRLRIRKISVE